MEIRKALVDAYFAGNPIPGIYQAWIGDRVITVQHTSPYYGRTDGFAALPQPNSYILVVNPHSDYLNNEEWFYLATIVPNQAGEQLSTKNAPAAPPAITDTTGKLGMPQSISLIGPGDHKIKIKHDYNESDKSTGIHLTTAAGKMIRMEDSPQIDNIVISCTRDLTGDYAALELQETIPEANGIPSSRMSYTAYLRASGGIVIQSGGSNVNIRVENQGGEINIENDSLGALATGGGPTGGNINIRSTNGAINIVAGPDPLDVAPGTVTQPIAAVNIQSIGGPATSMTLHTDGVLKLSGGLGVEIVGGDNRIVPVPSSNVSILGTVIGLNSPGI